MEEIKNYIDGKWLKALSGKVLPNFEPATSLQFSTVPDSDGADVDLAVKAAKAALADWRNRSVQERSKILRKISDLIKRDLEKLARAESLDTGKPFDLARSLDIPRAAQNFEFFADAILETPSESFRTDEKTFNEVQRSPLGVVGCISPWNLPLYLFTWKIAPALASGNCVIAKPSEVTPLTAFIFSQISAEAGLPAGVLNIVHGLGPKVGGAISSHPEIKAVSFTGSTKTGAEISRVAAPLFKKLSLEMGGKNPTLVFADCDFDQTIKGVLRSAFLNQGQICLCGSRILVEKTIYEKFKTALVNEIKKMKVGDPSEEGTDQGAVVSKEHFDKVLGCIATARKEGGKILVGGNAIKVSGRCEKGWFIEPTLIEGLNMNCKTNQEEIFGPVATIMPFASEEEGVALANSTRYGLAASIWTSDEARAQRVASQIESGIVWVNCWMVRDLRTPFGGVKDSGVGREGGQYALNFFSELKNICYRGKKEL